MSGVLCSFVGGSYGAPIPEIGEAYEGGFFAGQINDGGTVYNLVVAPKASGESSSSLQWKTSNTSTSGTTSTTDGPSNTSAMISAGAAAHPAANFCNGLSIGGYSDWYLPAKHELELLYYNFKPTTGSNNTSSGANPAAIPSHGNYTSGNPAQTSVTAFQTGNSEAFGGTLFYWASTEVSATNAWWQYFIDGEQVSGSSKSNTRLVRAIRRVAA